jgi:hypothetical protein
MRRPLHTLTLLTLLALMTSGQADLKLADGETHVDLAEVISEVGRAVDAFFHVAKETSAHAG